MPQMFPLLLTLLFLFIMSMFLLIMVRIFWKTLNNLSFNFIQKPKSSSFSDSSW